MNKILKNKKEAAASFLFFNFYFTYSFNGFTLYCNSPIFSVVTYPAGLLITSGIRFTTLAQVSSTVAGLATTIVVSGSP